MAFCTELYCLVAMCYLSQNCSYRTKKYLESIINCVVTCPEQINQSLELFYGVNVSPVGLPVPEQFMYSLWPDPISQSFPGLNKTLSRVREAQLRKAGEKRISVPYISTLRHRRFLVSGTGFTLTTSELGTESFVLFFDSATA